MNMEKPESLQELSPLERVSRHQMMPVSSGQERLWYLTQVQEPAYVYNEQIELMIEGTIEIALLKRGMEKIIARHDLLRTVFTQTESGEVRQIIRGPFTVDIPMITISSDGLNDGEIEKEIGRISLEQGSMKYDLSQGPLFRICIIQLPGNRQLCLISFHHIILDGRSIEVMLEEINALIDAEYERPSSLYPKPPTQWSDYSYWENQWLTSEAFRHRLDYWERQLKDMPPLLELPLDHPRASRERFFGGWQKLIFSTALTEKLQSVSWQMRVAPFIYILAAFNVLLSRYSNQTDIVVGTIVANRNKSQLKDLIGFLAETVPIRSDLSPGKSFRQLLNELSRVTDEAFYKYTVPLNKLVERLRCNGTLTSSINPIQAALVYDSLSLEDKTLAGRKIISSATRPMGATKFDLTLSLEIKNKQLSGYLEYNRELFNASTIQSFSQYFQTLLLSALEDPEQNIATLSLLTDEQRKKILYDYNNTVMPYPKNRCIHQLFEAQVKRDPDKTALVYQETEISYRELDNRSNQLAHYLIECGIGADLPVGICLARSPEMIVAILGVLKAGGCYVPIDSNYPPQRIDYLLDNSRIRLLLTHDHTELVSRERPEIRCFCLDADWHRVRDYSQTAPDLALSAENLAYIIYTSGSTGKPKGVAISHYNVNRLVINNEYLDLTTNLTLLHASSISFDAATFEIWAALLNGNKLVLYPEPVPTAETLEQIIRSQQVDTLFLTTALFNLIVDERPSALRPVKYLMTGGEALSGEHIRKAHKHCPNTLLMNVYGPTESTTYATCYPIPHDSTGGGSIPIGKPIGNTTAYILDTELNPVPWGIAGELYIGGDGLARGYLHRPDLTAEKFIPNPFGKAGERLYKTGDLVRYLSDGNIDFIGRIDHQVKVRGFRIELGEIETTLLELQGVRDACVIDHRRDNSGSNHFLAAFIVPEKGFSLSPEQLREDLKRSLPDYMLPACFTFVDAMPLTPNGKIDRKALPLPELQALRRPGYVPAANETENELVKIWAEVLNLPRNQIGISQDFFELGGDSLSLMRVISQCQKYNFKISVKDIFENRTIRQIATLLTGSKRSPEKQISLEREIKLDNSISASGLPTIEAGRTRAVFLTGASGFVGAFLLKELLRQTTADIFCLLRAESNEHAVERIRERLKRYGLYDAKKFPRVIPVIGDLSKPLFGLTPALFDSLGVNIDSIVHSGAWVNHVYPYDTLRSANVSGTHEILKLATTAKLKAVHHLSILNTDLVEPGDFERWASGPGFGYGLTKYAAEKMVGLAAERGVPISVYRLGMISGDQRGISNTSDRICLLIKGCIALNAIPNAEGLAAICSPTLTPVDFVAESITALLRQKEYLGGTYNIVNPEPVAWRDLLAALEETGYSLELVSLERWRDRLKEAANKQSDEKIYEILCRLYIEETDGVDKAPFSEEFKPDEQFYFMRNRINELKIRSTTVIRQQFCNYLKYLIKSSFINDPDNNSLTA